MLSYVVGFVAFLLVFANPIAQLFSPATPQIRRTPRPQLNPDLLALEGEDGLANHTSSASLLECPPDPSSVHIFSREPLVLYIEGFLLPEERAHLLEIRFVGKAKEGNEREARQVVHLLAITPNYPFKTERTFFFFLVLGFAILPSRFNLIHIPRQPSGA